MISCLAKVIVFIISGRKPWTIVKRFGHICLRTHNSSLEGATKLNSAALEMPFPMISCFADRIFSSGGEGGESSPT